MKLILLSILIALLGVAISIYFVYKLFGGTERKRNLFNFIISITTTAFLCMLIGWYLNNGNIPTSVSETIDIVLSNKLILSKIGNYQSYSYKKSELPNAFDNPAVFSMSVTGYYNTIYITCKVQKISLGKWQLKNIKEDSLKRNRQEIIKRVDYLKGSR